MSLTQATPQTPEEQAEVDYGDHVIWRLVNSTITSFGSNEDGEIFLSTVKDGVNCAFVIGKDEHGDLAIFEIEKESK
jgi:hypothetical protein